jgi:uncharacterized protein YdeI (YjbR/CyaY-like superfamily)
MDKTEPPIVEFKTADEWRQWLAQNHEQSAGVWLRFYKKAAGVTSVNYAEALDEALCYGWIDSQLKKYDDKSYLQKFTPRRSKSVWSRRNIEHIERLIKEGRMQPAGLKQVAAAKADGRWHRAYDSPANMETPADFLEALNKNHTAKKFFQTLNKTNTYAIAWRLQTAKKPETRQRRIEVIIAMLAEGKKFY